MNPRINAIINMEKPIFLKGLSIQENKSDYISQVKIIKTVHR